MTPTTFDITIRDPSNTLPPHTTRVADVLPGNLSNHRTDFDVLYARLCYLLDEFHFLPRRGYGIDTL